MTETELPLIQTSSVCVFSAVAEQNVFFFWGGGGEGQLGRAKLGGSGEKYVKIFEISIPEFVANASNFKN